MHSNTVTWPDTKSARWRHFLLLCNKKLYHCNKKWHHHNKKLYHCNKKWHITINRCNKKLHHCNKKWHHHSNKKWHHHALLPDTLDHCWWHVMKWLCWDTFLLPQYEWTALMGASKNGHANIVEKLLAAGAQPDFQNRVRNCFLYWYQLNSLQV